MIAAFFRFEKKFFDYFMVFVFKRMLEFLKVFDENPKHAGKIFAICQAYVAPHFGRARRNSGGVLKAIRAEHGLFFGMDGAEDVIGKFGRDHVWQMAGAADEFIVRIGRQLASTRAPTSFPEVFDVF